MAAPIPALAPVTTATLPCHLSIERAIFVLFVAQLQLKSSKACVNSYMLFLSTDYYKHDFAVLLRSCISSV